jgi:hypothetical protein
VVDEADALVLGVADMVRAPLGALVLGALGASERGVSGGVPPTPWAKAPPAASARIEVASKSRFIEIAPGHAPGIRRHDQET